MSDSDMDYETIDFDDVEINLHPVVDATCARDALYAIRQLRARVAELEAENERLQCLCDTQYAAGVKAGWNYCVADDHEGMEACIEDRQRDALPRLKELRMAPNSEGE